MKLFIFSSLLVGLGLAATVVAAGKSKSLYDHEVLDASGKATSLAAFKHKPVVLVVNVASQCGFTDSNYRQLQQLYEKYADQGLEIMAFPSNQFGGQEPGSNAEIQRFVKDKYRVTFPVFGKVDVNGPKAAPLFQWLKAETPAGGKPKGAGPDLRWNFEKHLLVNGVPTRRYSHDTFPEDMERDLAAALRTASEADL